MAESCGLQSLLQVELLSKPVGVARQETELSQVADIHDIYAVLTVRKLDYGPAQQSKVVVSSITCLVRGPCKGA